MTDLRYTVAEVLRGRWWVFLVAFVVSLVATPILRAIAYRLRIVDRPDDFLKPHVRPVAYLGGAAMCIGLLAGLGGCVVVMPGLAAHWSHLTRCLVGCRFGSLPTNPLWSTFGIALSGVVITVVGLLDDLITIRPRQKVAGQELAAGLLLIGGVGDRMATVFFRLLRLPAPDWLLVPLSVVMCLIAVIAACNATNLLDGLDGLCGGVTGIIALGFLALAVWLAIWGRFPGTDELRVGLCLAMAGAVFGFLPYNIPPASIFMGDAGSMLLGFFVATMMALFCQEGNARWFVASLAVFALPILDTALAVVRRIIGGRSIFAGDRSHLYDQLVDRGMTVKQVVALFYLVAVGAAGVGVCLAIWVRGRHAVAVYALLLVVVWGVFWKLRMVKPDEEQPGRHGSGGPVPRD
jgi:UDP-GlcNAc:undecaprenyl-phosphate GlcNAc-1-phosphate transferase